LAVQSIKLLSVNDWTIIYFCDKYVFINTHCTDECGLFDTFDICEGYHVNTVSLNVMLADVGFLLCFPIADSNLIN